MTRTRPSDVATSHAQLIKALTMPQGMDLHFHHCSCYFARLKIKNSSSINSMFPLRMLHVLSSICKYLCSLGAFLGENVGEITGNEKQRKIGVLFLGTLISAGIDASSRPVAAAQTDSLLKVFCFPLNPLDLTSATLGLPRDPWGPLGFVETAQ